MTFGLVRAGIGLFGWERAQLAAREAARGYVAMACFECAPGSQHHDLAAARARRVAAAVLGLAPGDVRVRVDARAMGGTAVVAVEYSPPGGLGPVRGRAVFRALP